MRVSVSMCLCDCSFVFVSSHVHLYLMSVASQSVLTVTNRTQHFVGMFSLTHSKNPPVCAGEPVSGQASSKIPCH